MIISVYFPCALTFSSRTSFIVWHDIISRHLWWRILGYFSLPFFGPHSIYYISKNSISIALDIFIFETLVLKVKHFFVDDFYNNRTVPFRYLLYFVVETLYNDNTLFFFGNNFIENYTIMVL